jgi:hypothetical protein
MAALNNFQKQFPGFVLKLLLKPISPKQDLSYLPRNKHPLKRELQARTLRYRDLLLVNRESGSG